MIEIEIISKTDAFLDRDYKFENLVVWEVNYSQGDYNLSTRDFAKSISVPTVEPKAQKIKTTKPSTPKGKPKEQKILDDSSIQSTATSEIPQEKFAEVAPVEAKPAADIEGGAKVSLPAPEIISTPPPQEEQPLEQHAKDESVEITPPEQPKVEVETTQPASPVSESKKAVAKPKPKLTPEQKRIILVLKKARKNQFEPDKFANIKAFSISEHQELNKLFPDKSPVGRNAEKDLENAEHERLLKEQEESYKKDERTKHTYNLKDFPLAEPELINKLAETHSKYFSLLTKLQDTHTPEDFVTAFRIQDRIAYLLDNQTLLYKSLTKTLIEYLERINERIEKYLANITLKQEDIKRMNAQISRFNEYDRKTQTKIDQVEKQTNLFQEEIQSYQDSLTNLQIELPQTKFDPENASIKSEESQPNNEAIVH